MPSFVVLGSESSGKSTLLERVSMFHMFPRGDGICTRMAIKVELRRTPVAAPPVLQVVHMKTNKPIVLFMMQAPLQVCIWSALHTGVSRAHPKMRCRSSEAQQCTRTHRHCCKEAVIETLSFFSAIFILELSSEALDASGASRKPM